jgi:hypothetical protein
LKADKGQQPQVPAPYPLGISSQSLQLTFFFFLKHLRKVRQLQKKQGKKKTKPTHKIKTIFPSPPTFPNTTVSCFLFSLSFCLPSLHLGSQRHGSWQVEQAHCGQSPIFSQGRWEHHPCMFSIRSCQPVCPWLPLEGARQAQVGPTAHWPSHLDYLCTLLQLKGQYHLKPETTGWALDT